MIAIKTATQNDLTQPENQDLLSPTNRVRAIITKQALQEGWDCPFAYVLCALAANSNLSAMTQLVGRILRQPNGIRTGIASLDECYVITHHTDTATVVGAVKNGLEQDGLGDLILQVVQGDELGAAKIARKIGRRSGLASTEIYLPRVLVVLDGEPRDLDYETDVLSAIDWRSFDPEDIANRVPYNAQAAEKVSFRGSSLPMMAMSYSLARPSRPVGNTRFRSYARCPHDLRYCAKPFCR